MEDIRRVPMARLCGPLAAVLFTLAWIVEGWARPGYSWLRHPVSALAIGPQGWMQAANFVCTGVLLGIFAMGLRRHLALAAMRPLPGTALLAVAVGLIGAGVFTTAPMNGYPEGTALVPEHTSAQFALHRLFSALVFFGFPTAMWSAARVLRGRWAARVSLFAMMLFLLGFAGMVAGFAQVTGLAPFAGLWQRVALVSAFAWVAIIAFVPLSRAHLPMRRDG